MIYCSLCETMLDSHDEWEISYAVCEPCHINSIKMIHEDQKMREDQEGYDHWLETEKKREQSLGCDEND